MRVPALGDLPDQTSDDAFWDVVGRVEHEQLDFKLRSDRLTETMAAMAMTDGGLIILGVRDDRSVAGCPLDQATLDRTMATAHDVGVEVQLRAVTVGEHIITVVAVPEVRGRIVTTPDGRLLRRHGSSSQPLVGDALARFVREREGRSAEDDALPVAALDDVDAEILNRALAAAGRPRIRRDGVPRALVDLGVARIEPPPTGTVLTKAAALLFAVDPRRYVSGACVQVVRRAGVGPGPGPTTARVELVGPLPRLLDAVLEFVQRNTPTYQAVVGTHRETLPSYPVAAVREAVLNALAHRDYGLPGATVDVTIWDDRMEVHSPGPLPGHITLENIREEHYSRNRRTMAVLKLLGLVEEYGEGIDRMYREMEARLMEPPLINAGPASVVVTLYSRSLLTPEDQAWLALLGHLGLTPAERRMLVLTRREEAITPRRVRAVMPDVDEDSLIAGAIAKGLLVRTGERGGTRYVLSDEIVLRAGASGLEARVRQRQRLLDEVRRRGSLSVPEASTVLGEDAALARHLLNDLARAGLVAAQGRTRARRYYSPELVGLSSGPSAGGAPEQSPG